MNKHPPDCMQPEQQPANNVTRRTHLVEAVLPLLGQLRHLAKGKAHGLQDAEPLLAAGAGVVQEKESEN